MIVLGIESTAHTFGAGVIDNKKVLSNVRSMFTTESGGIIPISAARHHEEKYKAAICEALGQAGSREIDLVSYSHGPGLGPCLRVGLKAAREFAKENKCKIIGVNHCVAHLEVGSLATVAQDPVLLYASGANTQVIAYDAGKYRVFGETIDIGVGNFLDTFARELDLGFPGGPKIQALASQGRNYIELPYVVKGMDVSFGGILTNLKQKIKSGQFSKEDLCYSCQETAFAMLLEVAERALWHTGKKQLLLGGGVACNTRLKEMAQRMCKDSGFKCFIPDNSLLVDNAAMIAWLGLLEHEAGMKQTIESSSYYPYERTDDVDVKWKK